MMVDRTYLMDSDVFITAKNLYYSFGPVLDARSC